MSAMRSVMGVVGLLLVAALMVAAEQCDVKLERSPCGTYTRLSTGSSKLFIVNPMDTGDWMTFSLERGIVVATFYNGSVYVRDFDKLVERKKEKLTEFFNMKLTGTAYSLEKGEFRLKSTSGDLFSVSSDNQGSFTMKGPYGEFGAFNMDKNSPISSMVVQNRTIVSTVDRKCSLNTVPIHKLSNHDEQFVEATQKPLIGSSLLRMLQ